MNKSLKRLEKIVRNFKNKRVLLIGDLMLDEYIIGKTTRISPEAPVPIVEVQQIFHLPGGAANAANNVRALGDDTFLVGIVGFDENGKKLKNQLKNAGININGIFEDVKRCTTLKSRVICQEQHLVRFDKEQIHPISRKIEQKLLDFITKAMKKVDIVHISDYAKGVLSPSFCQRIIKTASLHNKKVVIDPKGADFTKYKGCYAITPNLKELEAVLKIQHNDLKSLPQSANMLLAHVQTENVIVTLGENGMALFNKNKEYIHIPAGDVKVVDVSGAGDTAIATISLALAANATLQEAMWIATYACSVSVGKLGAATVSEKELLWAFDNVRLRTS